MWRIQAKNAPFIFNLKVLLLVACIGNLISTLGGVRLHPQPALDVAGQNKLLQGENTKPTSNSFLFCPTTLPASTNKPNNSCSLIIWHLCFLQRLASSLPTLLSDCGRIWAHLQDLQTQVWPPRGAPRLCKAGHLSIFLGQFFLSNLKYWTTVTQGLELNI